MPAGIDDRMPALHPADGPFGLIFPSRDGQIAREDDVKVVITRIQPMGVR
jgi:hypothetical protein